MSFRRVMAALFRKGGVVTRGDASVHLINYALNHVGENSGTPYFPCATTMTTSARGGALHRTMLSEGVVGGSRWKIRRDGVLYEAMNPGGWYGGGDKPRPQSCGRAHHFAAPASGTPSFPCATTIKISARGGALHRTMFSVGVVGGSREKMRKDGMLDEGMEG